MQLIHLSRGTISNIFITSGQIGVGIGIGLFIVGAIMEWKFLPQAKTLIFYLRNFMRSKKN